MADRDGLEEKIAEAMFISLRWRKDIDCAELARVALAVVERERPPTALDHWRDRAIAAEGRLSEDRLRERPPPTKELTRAVGEYLDATAENDKTPAERKLRAEMRNAVAALASTGPSLTEEEAAAVVQAIDTPPTKRWYDVGEFQVALAKLRALASSTTEEQCEWTGCQLSAEFSGFCATHAEAEPRG